jgi:hypothetical protein
MVHPVERSVFTQAGLKARLRACLGSCQAMDLHGLTARLSADAMLIRYALDELVACGEVEVLRPMYGTARRSHYRLLRSDDQRYQRPGDGRMPILPAWYGRRGLTRVDRRAG